MHWRKPAFRPPQLATKIFWENKKYFFRHTDCAGRVLFWRYLNIYQALYQGAYYPGFLHPGAFLS
jgi:hypothetical protein